MTITRKHIERAINEARDPWAVSNGVLYALCRRHPGHGDLKASTAKMLLIGRAYAASAERGRSAGSSANASGDEFYTRDLPMALKRSSIDTRLKPLRDERRPTAENARLALAVHADLTALLQELTGLEKRSLASKYLHFHIPQVFFLFDGRAERALRGISPVRPRATTLRDMGGDPAYARFSLRALALMSEVRGRFGVSLSPRQLDRVLLALDAGA